MTYERINRVVEDVLEIKKIKQINKLVQEIHEIEKLNDTEDGHVLADRILCELLISLGYEKVINAYNKLNKWYS